MPFLSIFNTRKPRSKKVLTLNFMLPNKKHKASQISTYQILEWLESRFVYHLFKFLSLWIINVNMNSNFVPKSIKMCKYLLTLTQILELSKSRFVCHLFSSCELQISTWTWTCRKHCRPLPKGMQNLNLHVFQQPYLLWYISSFCGTWHMVLDTRQGFLLCIWKHLPTQKICSSIEGEAHM